MLVRLIDLQRGHALEVFQKAAAQRGVNVQILFHQALGDLLYHHDGHRDQRHADEQHKACLEVYKAQQAKQGQRGQEAVEELGQIAAEVGLQLLHALHGKLGQLRGGHALPVACAQAQEFVIDLLPQDALHIRAGQIRHFTVQPIQHEFQRHRQKYHKPPAQKHALLQAAEQRGVQQRGRRPDGGHLAPERQPLQHHLPDDVFLRMAQ